MNGAKVEDVGLQPEVRGLFFEIHHKLHQMGVKRFSKGEPTCRWRWKALANAARIAQIGAAKKTPAGRFYAYAAGREAVASVVGNLGGSQASVLVHSGVEEV
jgi:hypothetical protein